MTAAPAASGRTVGASSPVVAVLDFETTGGSPGLGDRPTEIGIVLLEGGRIVDRWASLMNAGLPVPPFIEALTGITNAMVRAAPPAAQVMAEARRFVGDAPLVAHNAAFDRRFWQTEMARLEAAGGGGHDAGGGTAPMAVADFACTLLLSRRLYPDAPSHRLGRLAQLHGLPDCGQAHRALADAETAAHLLVRICRDLASQFGIASAHHALLLQVQRCARQKLATVLARHAAGQTAAGAPFALAA